MQMNQTPAMLRLLDFTGSDHPFGNTLGKAVYRKLADHIDSLPTQDVFGISLEGIEATDASFPRESIVSLAKQYRGEKGFFLTGFKSKDLLDNWDYGAKAKEQPLVVWTDSEYELIGPEVSGAARKLLDFVLKHKVVTASKVAQGLDISVPNASNQLKNLVKQGFILRSEAAAESGGIEYVYKAIC